MYQTNFAKTLQQKEKLLLPQHLQLYSLYTFTYIKRVCIYLQNLPAWKGLMTWTYPSRSEMLSLYSHTIIQHVMDWSITVAHVVVGLVSIPTVVIHHVLLGIVERSCDVLCVGHVLWTRNVLRTCHMLCRAPHVLWTGHVLRALGVHWAPHMGWVTHMGSHMLWAGVVVSHHVLWRCSHGRSVGRGWGPIVCRSLKIEIYKLLLHAFHRIISCLNIYCLVLKATFNNFSVISRHFLGKLPVLLVHFSWHQSVSRYAILSTKEGSHWPITTIFGITKTGILPTISHTKGGPDPLPLHHRGVPW